MGAICPHMLRKVTTPSATCETMLSMGISRDTYL
jgi:hypothetical protein